MVTGAKNCPCGKPATLALIHDEWVCGCAEGCGEVDAAIESATDEELPMKICRSIPDAVRQWNAAVDFCRMTTA